MPEIKITNRESGGHTLIVDGVDMSMAVTARGTMIEFHEFPAAPTVTIELCADVLDIDLPEAIVALRKVDSDA